MQSFTSIIDQFLLSGLNFAVGVLLIRITSKEEYGIYTQLFAAGLLGTTLLDAFLGATLTTLASGKTQNERSIMIASSFRIQSKFSICISAFFGAACTFTLYELHESKVNIFALGTAYAAYIYTLTRREFNRTISFLERNSSDVLLLDGLFVLYAIAGVAICHALECLNLVSDFLILSAANIIPEVKTHTRQAFSSHGSSNGHWLLKKIWPLSKWSIPGAFVGWSGNYSFLYLAYLLLGLSAAADLSASRLL